MNDDVVNKLLSEIALLLLTRERLLAERDAILLRCDFIRRVLAVVEPRTIN